MITGTGLFCTVINRTINGYKVLNVLYLINKKKAS